MQSRQVANHLQQQPKEINNQPDHFMCKLLSSTTDSHTHYVTLAIIGLHQECVYRLKQHSMFIEQGMMAHTYGTGQVIN